MLKATGAAASVVGSSWQPMLDVEWRGAWHSSQAGERLQSQLRLAACGASAAAGGAVADKLAAWHTMRASGCDLLVVGVGTVGGNICAQPGGCTRQGAQVRPSRANFVTMKSSGVVHESVETAAR